MPQPGYKVVIGDTPASSLVASDSSNGFLVGGSNRGPLDDVQLIVSLSDFVNKCGGRIEGFPTTYDEVESFFKEGGSALYFSREVGSSAAVASKNLMDAEGKIAAKFKAFNAGAWGNGLQIAVVNASSKLTGTVKLDGKTVLSFSELASNAALIALVNEKLADTVIAEAGEGGAVVAKTQTVTFTGGTDALGALTTETLQTALDNFNSDLGPGQVFAPMHTTDEAHQALAAHAEATGRCALLDEVEGADEAELVASAEAVADEDGDRFTAQMGTWAIIPGVSRSAANRKVPYSGIYAGQIARAEAQGYSPNQPPAGKKRGTCNFAIGLVSIFTDVQLGALNDAGVLMAKLVRGTPVTFGNVTVVDQSGDRQDWKSFSASRTMMTLAAKGGLVMENYEFEQIDGHGYIFKDLQGDLSNEACMPLYKANALYGTTPEEAFAVETGPDVNTPASIANEEIRAQIAARVSPTGERLELEIVKVPTTETL